MTSTPRLPVPLFYTVQLTCIVASPDDAIAVSAELAQLTLPASLVSRTVNVSNTAALREMLGPIVDRVIDAAGKTPDEPPLTT